MIKNKFNIIIFILWFITVVFTFLHHELWRDEAQVWCLARDCGFFEMLNSARIEGHPVLWYILVFPFAKLGLNVISMQFLALFFSLTGVYILIFKSNLSNFQKIITVFSAGMLYYFPVVARNYSLIPPVLFLLALFWKDRSLKPYIYSVLLILLSHTHSYMFGLYIVLSLFFIIENGKKTLIANLILIINAIILFLWFNSALKYNYALHTKMEENLSVIRLILFLSQVYVFEIINTLKPLIKYAVPLSVLMFIPFISGSLLGFFKENKKVFIILSCGIGFIFFTFLIVYFNGILYQKLYLIILLLIFGTMLLENKQNKLISYSINTLLILSCITSFIVVKNDIIYNFSGGKQIADYIKQNYNTEKTFIAFGNPYLYSSISAYLPEKKFYSPVAKDYISYFTYNPRTKTVPFPKEAKIYIIDEKVDPERAELKVLFESDKKNLSSRLEREVFKICKDDET